MSAGYREQRPAAAIRRWSLTACASHMGSDKTGGLRAFDVATGAVKWCFDHGSPAASSPIMDQMTLRSLAIKGKGD